MMLFDVESDPREERNIAGDHPEIVADLLREVEELKKGRPRHPRYWMMSPNWTQGFVAGKVQDGFDAPYQIDFYLVGRVGISFNPNCRTREKLYK